MWDHRNTVLHDPEGPIISNENKEVNAAIIYEYFVGPEDLQSADQHLFTDSVEYTCSMSLIRKKLWLQDLKNAKTRPGQSSLQDVTRRRSRQAKDIPASQPAITPWLNQE